MSELTDRDRAILWARGVLEKDFIVLDTETTGLRDDAEACQIGLVSKSGEVLLDTLVKPRSPIGPSAMQVHGITNEMVKDAPGFEAIYPQIVKRTNGKLLLIYNLDFDWRIIQQSLRACGHSRDEVNEAMDALCIDMHCVMEWFAKFYGDWNDYYGSYKWQKLTTAAYYLDIEIEAAHSAAADALTTLGVVEKMAASKLRGEEGEHE